MSEGRWVSTSKAAIAVGVSANYLRKHRERMFVSGKHWLNLNPTAWRPTYRWDVVAVAKVLGKSVGQIQG